MLTNLSKQHANERNRNLSEIEKARKAVLHNGKSLSKVLLQDLNQDVAQVAKNQQEIHQKVNLLKKNSAIFKSQTHQWMTLLNSLTQELQSLGSMETWSQSIESDLTKMAASLDFIYNSTGSQIQAQTQVLQDNKEKLSKLEQLNSAQ